MKTLELDGIKKVNSGKVRELFEVGENLLLVSTDRISAFDHILPQPITDKGKVLNSISVFWFDKLKEVIDNHLITADVNEYPESLHPFKAPLDGRSMLVKKTSVIKLECIVRGYITGSGWNDYLKTGSICGIKLPAGLQKSQKLDEPLFTPSTKADIGEHDENIDAKSAKEIIGKNVFDFVQKKSIALYKKAHDYAKTKGIIIADTKFEFGIQKDGSIILIDEVLTPDSSRFWPADLYEIGKEQLSFDKQFVRNYLLDLKWDKQSPVPELPEEIVSKTSEKYKEAYQMLTGIDL